MKETVEGLAKLERESRQLRRLEVLIDVIFAIVIWRIFILIPRPGTSNWHWDAIGPFLSANVLTFVLVALAIVIVIIYWLQNNALFNNLDRTDSRHTAISIVQIFFLLCFLLAIRLGVVLEASAGTRAFESSTAALVGIASAWGWSYAIKNRRLVSPDLTDQEAGDIQIRFLAEPVTALITIPCAFVGPWIWEVSWLLYPLIAFILRRRRKASK